MSIIYSECLVVALVISIQSACVVLRFHLWPVRFYRTFPHYLINGTIFEGKTIVEHGMCV